MGRLEVEVDLAEPVGQEAPEDRPDRGGQLGRLDRSRPRSQVDRPAPKGLLGPSRLEVLRAPCRPAGLEALAVRSAVVAEVRLDLEGPRACCPWW